ncbi:SOH1-domain-containing protein [Microthyrium microscopicum]|uniref:Mediator of RNA polymerase II transcription subunit 31 n=1 Tax=Microthyrium microscopicum TaxID=703497 RepID=A0A6A6UBP6_9PEZI|nr:SOH1-domain-containing protein [Microthyrium microscopicum]
MADNSSNQQSEPEVPVTQKPEPKYGSKDPSQGSTRFELELEFVQCLGNGWYLNHLAGQKLLEKPDFVRYIDYLQYWKQPEYACYLSYPGPSLKALELLQQEKFRQDILKPDVLESFVTQMANAGKE